MKVFLVTVVSADGLMGRDAAQRSVDWRSKEDGALFSQLTRQAGVVVMGAATYNTFSVKRGLPGRKLVIYTHHPETATGDGVEPTTEDPRALVRRMEGDGYSSLAVAGGATINKLFLDSGLVEEIYLTVEPVLFGSGIPQFSGAVYAQLTLLESRLLNGNTILLHYAVNR